MSYISCQFLNNTDAEKQVEALSAFGQVLAQTGRWEGAERAVAHIEDTYMQAKALSKLGQILAQAGRYYDLLRLIQRFWLLARTRDEALQRFSLATHFIPQVPELGMSLYEGVAWVNSFLLGKSLAAEVEVE